MKDNGNADGLNLGADESLTLAEAEALMGALQYRKPILEPKQRRFLLALMRETRGSWDDDYCPLCNRPYLPEDTTGLGCARENNEYCEGRH